MSDAKELGIAPATAGTGGGAAVSLGKGAWDCDANREIPPEKEARPPRARPARARAAALRGLGAVPRSSALDARATEERRSRPRAARTHTAPRDVTRPAHTADARLCAGGCV